MLKLKTKEFRIMTRSLTLPAPPVSYDDLVQVAVSLRERVECGERQLFRLVGVGISGFREQEDSAGEVTPPDNVEPMLFEEDR